MEKRVILAFALSLLVLLTWSRIASKLYPIDNKGVIEQPPSPAPPISTSISAPSFPPEPVEVSLLRFSQKKWEITFIEPRAAIQEVIFKDYQSSKFPLKYGFFSGDKQPLFKKEEISEDAITFGYRDPQKQITKRFLFSKSNYSIELEIKTYNLSNLPITLNLPLTLAVLSFGKDQAQMRFQDVTVAEKDKISHPNGRKDARFEEVKFLGVRDRYFCAIIEPEGGNYAGFIKKISPQESEIGLQAKELTLAPGQQIVQKFHIYLGPQELKLINLANAGWSAVMYYGTFDFIAQILLQILEALYRLLHNWGGAIVLLSLLIYLLLFPLILKQMRSMKQMQALQPHIERLRKEYKDNPQRLNKEMLELYREHKVNPFGGCLPLILQVPVFFALYQVLMRSVALKGAPFLWIKDLSGPDRLFMLPISLPILGNEINILPILMAIGMFIQQKISMVTTSSSSAEQQRLMLILFPLLFGIIFYHMPAGLVLYWFINSTLMLVYQFRISRIK
jgi:YidC/Oxa1 family membrane protein insertase